MQPEKSETPWLFKYQVGQDLIVIFTSVKS